MESIWPPLAIYPLIRQRHIKSIPIDLANEIAPGGARLTQRAQGQEDYLWLDLNNLQKMMHILSRDFSRYWPEYSEIIQDNRQQLQQVIQQRQLFFDAQLFAAQIESVAVTDEKLLPMALSLALPIVAEQQADLVLTPTPVDKAGYWWVDPLLRPSHQSLVQWLMALEEQLQRALASRS
jgi:2-hydroxychromene-2-carboxylate isomerase